MESAFNPRAVSPKGAMGLMQLMPSTAKRTSGSSTLSTPPRTSAAGVRYLRQLLDRYNDNEQLALAAYNAGPGAVDKYGSKVPPYKETQNYVKQDHRHPGQRRNGPSRRIYKVTSRRWTEPSCTYTKSETRAAAPTKKSRRQICVKYEVFPERTVQWQLTHPR